MKILFLDIDGVLNRQGTKEKVEVLGALLRGVDRRLLAMLQEWLTEHEEVSVVLSSSWRNHETLVEHLERAGLKFIGKTGRASTRGREIEIWLGRHPDITHYAILDDISAGMSPVGSRLVQTSEKFGLRPRNLRRLETLLELQPECAQCQEVSVSVAS